MNKIEKEIVKNESRIEVVIISVYMLITNILSLVLGIIIAYFKFNISNLTYFLVFGGIIKHPDSFFVRETLTHIDNATPFLTFLLGAALICFSIFQIYFTILLLLRKKSGAVGLFILSVIWIPFELLFISRFLIIPRLIGWALEAIIILLLFRIITHPEGYFRKRR